MKYPYCEFNSGNGEETFSETFKGEENKMLRSTAKESDLVRDASFQMVKLTLSRKCLPQVLINPTTPLYYLIPRPWEGNFV